MTTQQKIERLRNTMKYLKINSNFDITTDQILGKRFAITENKLTDCETDYLQPVTDFMTYEELNAFIIGISKAKYFTT